MTAERRQWSRYPTLSLGTVRRGPRRSGGERSSGCVTDVSLGGARIRFLSPPEVGTRLWVQIGLEGEGLEALAEVVHVDPSTRSVGVLLTRLSRASFAVLYEFVRAQQRPSDPTPEPALDAVPSPKIPPPPETPSSGRLSRLLSRYPAGEAKGRSA